MCFRPDAPALMPPRTFLTFHREWNNLKHDISWFRARREVRLAEYDRRQRRRWGAWYPRFHSGSTAAANAAAIAIVNEHGGAGGEVVPVVPVATRYSSNSNRRYSHQQYNQQYNRQMVVPVPVPVASPPPPATVQYCTGHEHHHNAGYQCDLRVDHRSGIMFCHYCRLMVDH